MNLGANTLGGVELAGQAGAGAGVVPPVQPVMGLLWHEELAHLYANQIERERRVLLGVDSSLEMFTQRGQTTESRKMLTRDFSVYHVSSLAGPEEWFLDIIETGNPWTLIREITDVCLNTHGQCLNFKIIALERPVEKGHCYRMRLQAINDPRI